MGTTKYKEKKEKVHRLLGGKKKNSFKL